jgi:hypothetical protein
VISDELPGVELHPDERLEMVARTVPADVALTDRRIIVQADGRTLLSLPVEGIRRIQLDVERGRPATLVLVPQLPIHEPQLLSVPIEHLDVTGRLVTTVGRRLDALG